MKTTLISKEDNRAKFTMDFTAEEFESAVIKAYQKNNGLVQTGTLDVDTQVCLRKPLEDQADVDGNIMNPDAAGASVNQN